MSEKYAWPLAGLDNPRLPLCLYGAGAVIFILTAWLWWAKVSVDPAHVFNGMLASSLSTTSTTLDLSQPGDGSAKEAIQLQFGTNTFAHALSSLSQNGNTVTTETIGTPAADYTRYATVKTNKTNKNGRPVDVSGIQNVWAKTTAAEAAQGQNTLLFEQAVLGIGLPLGSVPVPMGDVPLGARAALLGEMQGDNVYSPDIAKMKKGVADGRLAYAYPVTLQPVTYARLMQNFARALGLHDLDNFDPNSLSGQSPVEMTFVVDAHAQQLLEIDYASDNYKETYGNYGVISPVSLPQKTIPSTELQRRLSALQG